MLIDEIKKANIEAMKAHDADYRAAYSMIISRYQTALTSGKGETPTDADVISMLMKFSKELEEENMLLQKKIEKSATSEEADKEVTISRMKSEINQLKGALTKSFPKRVIQMRDARKMIISLQEYIIALQSLLTANGIAYEERQVKPSKAESINPEEMDIFAVRGPKENYEIEEGFYYKYPRPSVTADCIFVTKEVEQIQ